MLETGNPLAGLSGASANNIGTMGEQREDYISAYSSEGEQVEPECSSNLQFDEKSGPEPCALHR